MPRPKKTTAELQTMREQILDTALGILQAEGHEAITSRAIAERLGIAHMALFTYFKNQMAILRALREREMAKWQAQQQILEQHATPATIVQVVADILRLYIDFARDNPNLYRLVWVMPETGIESLEENRQRTLNTVGHLAGLLKQGMQAGVFEAREPFLTAGTALVMVNAPQILFHNGKLIDPSLRDQMVEEMLSAAMQYLEKKTE